MKKKVLIDRRRKGHPIIFIGTMDECIEHRKVNFPNEIPKIFMRDFEEGDEIAPEILEEQKTPVIEETEIGAGVQSEETTLKEEVVVEDEHTIVNEETKVPEVIDHTLTYKVNGDTENGIDLIVVYNGKSTTRHFDKAEVKVLFKLFDIAMDFAE